MLILVSTFCILLLVSLSVMTHFYLFSHLAVTVDNNNGVFDVVSVRNYFLITFLSVNNVKSVRSTESFLSLCVTIFLAPRSKSEQGQPRLQSIAQEGGSDQAGTQKMVS